MKISKKLLQSNLVKVLSLLLEQRTKGSKTMTMTKSQRKQVEKLTTLFGGTERAKAFGKAFTISEGYKAVYVREHMVGNDNEVMMTTLWRVGPRGGVKLLNA